MKVTIPSAALDVRYLAPSESVVDRVVFLGALGGIRSASMGTMLRPSARRQRESGDSAWGLSFKIKWSDGGPHDLISTGSKRDPCGTIQISPCGRWAN
jgi:hypothetical protein